MRGRRPVSLDSWRTAIRERIGEARLRLEVARTCLDRTPRDSFPDDLYAELVRAGSALTVLAGAVSNATARDAISSWVDELTESALHWQKTLAALGARVRHEPGLVSQLIAGASANMAEVVELRDALVETLMAARGGVA